MNPATCAGPSLDRRWPETIRELLTALESGHGFDSDQAAELLSALTLDHADLRPWQDFDHPVRDSYGRLLVAGGANYELMVMSWAPGDYSAIHDHGIAEWGAVRYFGAADHVIFRQVGGTLTLDQRMTMNVDDVFAIDGSLIHLMGNPTERPFVSLHLYGREHAADAVTGGARIFDLYENAIQRTDGGVFFCLPEADISRREPCPAADPPSRLLHHQLMLARMERIWGRGGRDPVLAERMASLRAQILQLSIALPERAES